MTYVTLRVDSLLPATALEGNRFMNRPATNFFLGLTAFAALSAHAAFAAPAPATLIIGGRTVPFVVSPFVNENGQVEGPVDAVRMLGADYKASSDTSVIITGPNSKRFTMPCRNVQGRNFVDLKRAALALGATADYQIGQHILTLRAKLQMVRQDSGALNIFTSYPVYYSVKHLDNPNRLYVDLKGVDLATGPVSVPIQRGGNAVRIRSGQIDYQTVRITVDLKRGSPFQIVSPEQSSRVRVAFDGGQPDAPVTPRGPVIASRPPSLPALPPSEGGPVLPAPVAATGIQITSVRYQALSDSIVQIAVTTNGEAHYKTEALNDPNRLAFDFLGAKFDENIPETQTIENGVIKAVRTGIYHMGATDFGRVVVDLTQLVGYTITSQVDNGQTTYLINLQMPGHALPGGSNSLAGRVVVVDPGHGRLPNGKLDTGAVGIGNVYEKDLTLAISKKLRDALQRQGATVYLTRDDDQGLSVGGRPQFAVAHNADYFISVHCDDSGPQNSHSGTTVYFHAQNGLCRSMASDILNRVSEVSGIRPLGVRSDTVRFQTGFGVLRGSPMPAVLVECGYMNCENDLAKLTRSETQTRIAEGIVAGLRDFVAGRSAHR